MFKEAITLVAGVIILICILFIAFMLPFGLACILGGYIAYTYIHLSGVVWWAFTIIKRSLKPLPEIKEIINKLTN